MSGIIVFALRVLLALALYAFLMWALYTIYQQLRVQHEMVANQSLPTLTITLVDADPPNVRHFSIQEVIIGRDPACQYHLASELVSAQHARVSFHHNQWWVEDLHSTNGTFLNGERIYTPTVLVNSDELTCGKVNLQLTFDQKS